MEEGIQSQGNQKARVGGKCILWGSGAEQYIQIVMGMGHFDERQRVVIGEDAPEVWYQWCVLVLFA